MAKFIIFNKLVDFGRITINMDIVKTMEPVSRLYDGHMKDCTDIYYENHRVTVLSRLEDIIGILTGMIDGDIVDISEALTQDDDQGTHGNPDDPGGDPIVYEERTVTIYRRDTPGNNSQHQLLATDSGMNNPWPSLSGVNTYNISIPTDQDYIYILYYELFDDNHHYTGWGIPFIFADESVAEEYIATQTDTPTLEWHGPVQVPLNMVFDVVNDSIVTGEPITKIYVGSHRQVSNARESNVVWMGVSDTITGAANVAGDSSSILELPLPSGEEVEISADGSYAVYLTYYITYKSKGGSRPYRNRFLYNAIPSRAFKNKNDALIYIGNKNDGVNIDTEGYEYKYLLVHTGLLYKTNGGSGLEQVN